MGLAWAWLLVFPLVPLFTFLRARGALKLTAGKLAAAVAPGLGAAAAMALPVGIAAFALAGLEPWQRLPLLVALGGAVYAALLHAFSRETLRELIALAAGRREDRLAT